MRSKLSNSINQSKTYRALAAFSLATLLLGVVVLKEVHHLFEHCHDHPTCEADGNETHFHGSEFLHADCFLCAFNFSPEEEIVFQNPTFSNQIILSENYFFYQNPFSEKVISFQYLRGPPNVIV